MAPVVHLNDSIHHRHTLDAVLQFVVEHRSCIVQSLVVDADWHNEVAEKQLRNVLAPGHLLASLERHAYIVGEERSGVVGDIGKWHVGIEELQRFLLVGGQLFFLCVVECFADCLHTLLEDVLYCVAVVGVGYELPLRIRCQTQCEYGGRDEYFFHSRLKYFGALIGGYVNDGCVGMAGMPYPPMVYEKGDYGVWS